MLKRAKRDNWTRDLAAAIKAKAEEKVSKAAVSKAVSKQRSFDEKVVVEANAELQANVVLSHRQDIKALRQTVLGMAGELGALAHNEIQSALELVLDEKCKDQSQQCITALNKAFDAALALGGRSSAGKNLVASLGILIDKERQAFGIDKDSGDRKSLGEWLDALS